MYFSAEDSDATVLAVKVENKKPEGPLSEVSKENSKETNEVAEGQNAESEEPAKPPGDPPSGSGSSDSDSTSSDSGSENDDLKDLDYGARPERRNKSHKKSSKKKSKKRSKDKAKEKENSEPSVKKDTSEQNSKSDRQDSSEERSDLPQDKIGGGSNSPTTQQVIDKVIRETVDDESSEEGVNEVGEANSISRQTQLGTRISTKRIFQGD